MPSWKTHIAFGFGFILAVLLLDYKYFHFLFLPTWKDWLWFVPVIMFYSLSPDLDFAGSKVKEFSTIFLLVSAVILIYLKGATIAGLVMLILLGVLWLLPLFGKWHHRGHMHSIVFIAVLSVPLLFVGGWKLYVIGFLAALSHLVADMEIKIF